MKNIRLCHGLFALISISKAIAFTTTTSSPSLLHVRPCRSIKTLLWSVGADIEQPDLVTTPQTSDAVGSPSRGKVNEIDFCIAPADVSLSRAYGSAARGSTSEQPILSLTRALNNASNRAIRRILLARSWPSAEALNMSLRQAASATAAQASTAKDAKCPVPRPILNVLTRKSGGPVPRSRTDEEYVADQLKSFYERYGSLPGYPQAEDYLEAILSLATSGRESTRAKKVIEAGVYDEAYRRVLGVLNTVGVVFETNADGGLQIAKKLIDQDICLSMIDKIRMRQGESESAPEELLSEVRNTGDREDKRKRGLFGGKHSKDAKEMEELTREDLGGVLLSATEPSMTRQLNVLSNIVQRALLFGGDQELLVLSETLFADRPAFVERWYPGTGEVDDDLSKDEDDRPGLQYLNCLVQLLRDCYQNGGVQTLEPPLPLSQSYANAYERLVASSVELGSGYIKPLLSEGSDLPKPRSAKEELGRFAVWETNFRKARRDVAAYPEDLVGTWEVRDIIGGEIIGVSRVIFKEDGDLAVLPPLEGLRWRLDGGPAHLDTCSFQVLSSDGTILQYRGFIDRGARLEASFSKRSLTIRGSVMFQMRDGSVDYYKDMLPINYRQGTTKFSMTKIEEQ